jgi:hypothetical protein
LTALLPASVSAKQAEVAEQPSKKGGKAAAIAKVLAGIDFPKTKDNLKQYAEMNVSNVEVKDPNAILNILEQLTDKKYNNMAEVEKSIRDVL